MIILLWPVFLLIYSVAFPGEVRTITDIKGRSMQAEVMDVDEDRVLIKRVQDGREFWLPFSKLSLIDRAHFEEILSKKNLPQIPFNQVNEVLGIQLLDDYLLWDDDASTVAGRLGWPKESETKSQSSFRYYPPASYSILGSRPYSSVLYGKNGKVEILSIVFANKGDLVENGRLVGSPEIQDIGNIQKKLEYLIGEEAKRMQNALVTLFGEPTRAKLGSRDLKEIVDRWDWGNHAFMLSEQEGEYLSLRIMSVALADNKGKYQELRGSELNERISANVKNFENGDVVLQNIPMVDQGPKGYCVPATFERYLRYMGMAADMYVLAMAGNTKIGGGTYMSDMLDGIRSFVSQNGRDLQIEKLDMKSIRDVSKFIDDGYPLMWTMYSSKSYNNLVNKQTQLRASTDHTDWEKEAEQFHELGDDLVKDRDAAHICMIIGYNENTNEVAVSDSWGDRYKIRWAPLSAVRNVSQGRFYRIDR